MLREMRLCDHCGQPIGPTAAHVEVTVVRNREATDDELVAMGMVLAPARPVSLPEGEEFDATPTARAYREEYGPRGGVPMVKADDATLHFCSDEHLRAKLA